MSSDTPSVPPAEDRPTEPFSRGRIVWSRPPQPVFRVGPLPRVAPAPATRPVLRPGAGILTGSMVPPARTASPAVEVLPDAPIEPRVETVAPQPEPVAPEPVVPEPVVEAVAPEPEPVAAAPAPQEIVIEPDAPEPAVTVPPPLSTEAKPAVKPRALPSVVVTPAIYASVGAAMQKVAKGDRWPIVAGVAALVVIGGFIWLATLPAPQPVAPAPTPLVADAAPLEGILPAGEVAPVAGRPAPVRAASAPAAASPVTAQPRRATPMPAAPAVAVPAAPTESAPRPYIETSPLVLDQPTPVAPVPTNPDAPASTAAQPSN